MNQDVMFSSNTNDWATPAWLFEDLDTEFNFTLDPCATADTAKCEKYYTQEDDGLSKNWQTETVFMNPPYGREISSWMKKAHKSYLGGATVVCLVPARTDTQWWHDYAMKASEIRLIKGRIKFLQNGAEVCGAPFPSAIVIFEAEQENQVPKFSAYYKE